jgi:hypothetical protein
MNGTLATAILISGKFKVLHGFEIVSAVFFHFGRIFTPLKRRKNRAFRGCALSRSGHIAPAGGAVSCFATPTIACAI